MPYLVITPLRIAALSYTLTNADTDTCFAFIVLSSTDPLHKTMLKDFQSWSYPMAYISLDAPTPPTPPSPFLPTDIVMEYRHPRHRTFVTKHLTCPRLAHARFTTHYDRLPSMPQCGSRIATRRWYAEHQAVAARTGYTEEVFKFWQRRHGRKIERRWLRSQREESSIVGVGNRIKYAWWRAVFWAKGKDMGGGARVERRWSYGGGDFEEGDDVGVSSRRDTLVAGEALERTCIKGGVRRSRSAPHLVGKDTKATS